MDDNNEDCGERQEEDDEVKRFGKEMLQAESQYSENCYRRAPFKPTGMSSDIQRFHDETHHICRCSWRAVGQTVVRQSLI